MPDKHKQSRVEVCSYKGDDRAVFVKDGRQVINPSINASSGGGGHWVAALSIIDKALSLLAHNNPDISINFPRYDNHKNINENSPAEMLIGFMQNVTNEHAYSQQLVKVLNYLKLPVLPTQKALTVVEAKVFAARSTEDKCNDILLRYCPAGARSAAIFNFYQQNGQTEELQKLLQLQNISDKQNEKTVYTGFLNDLKQRALAGEPFTTVISTQAMALPALCDAVIAYNQWLEKEATTNTVFKEYPKLEIHQYFTDLPTEGAIHFFNPLKKLSIAQQKVMKLYGVGMNDDIINTFFPKGEEFAGIYCIDAKENPMVRAAFTKPANDLSQAFNTACTIAVDGKNRDEKISYPIAAGETIATIMLGSQTSNDTIAYLETMLASGYQKVFVVGGADPKFDAAITKILSKRPEYSDRLVRLDPQEGDALTQLFTRSQLVIKRGGGLTIMEELALPHNPYQTVLIHHPDMPGVEPDEKNLSSGMSWENKNVDTAIEILKPNVDIKKTSPQLAKRHIPLAQLKLAIHNLQLDDKVKEAKMLAALPHLSTAALKKLLQLKLNPESANTAFSLLESFANLEEKQLFWDIVFTNNVHKSVISAENVEILTKPQQYNTLITQKVALLQKKTMEDLAREINKSLGNPTLKQHAEKMSQVISYYLQNNERKKPAEYLQGYKKYLEENLSGLLTRRLQERPWDELIQNFGVMKNKRIIPDTKKMSQFILAQKTEIMALVDKFISLSEHIANVINLNWAQEVIDSQKLPTELDRTKEFLSKSLGIYREEISAKIQQYEKPSIFNVFMNISLMKMKKGLANNLMGAMDSLKTPQELIKALFDTKNRSYAATSQAFMASSGRLDDIIDHYLEILKTHYPKQYRNVETEVAAPVRTQKNQNPLLIR